MTIGDILRTNYSVDYATSSKGLLSSGLL